MRKADLLANVLDEKPNKEQVVAGIFTAGEPVLELSWIDTTSIEPHLVRHFVWKGHYLTYRGRKAYTKEKWTKEQYDTALNGQGHMYATVDDMGAQGVIRKFLGDIGAEARWLSVYERMLVLEAQDRADKRKREWINARMKEITPPLPKGFIQWARKQGDGYVYLLQWNGIKTVDRRFEVRRDGRIVTEFVRGFSYAPGEAWYEYYYGDASGLYGCRQAFWDRKCWQGACNRAGMLYPETLKEVPWDTEDAFRAISEDAKNGIKADYGRLYREYQLDDRAERIVKSGYKALTDLWRKGNIHLFDVRPRDGVNEMLDLTKGRYRMLRQMNAGAAVIEAAQEGARERPYFSDRELKLLHKVPGEGRKRKIKNIALNRQLPIAHLITLLGKEPLPKIQKYADYLDMAQELGENVRDEIVYRNKRWEEYHDRHVAELAKIKADKRKKEVDGKYRKIRSKAAANKKRFGWETKGYLVTVPERASDIIAEGRTQHHCVGSSDTYIKSMNEGKTFIVFLRKSETPETPYYTIEAKPDGTIIQAYAAYDRKPDWDKVKVILDKWKKEVKRRTV